MLKPLASSSAASSSSKPVAAGLNGAHFSTKFTPRSITTRPVASVNQRPACVSGSRGRGPFGPMPTNPHALHTSAKATNVAASPARARGARRGWGPVQQPWPGTLDAAYPEPEELRRTHAPKAPPLSGKSDPEELRRTLAPKAPPLSGKSDPEELRRNTRAEGATTERQIRPGGVAANTRAEGATTERQIRPGGVAANTRAEGATTERQIRPGGVAANACRGATTERQIRPGGVAANTRLPKAPPLSGKSDPEELRRHSRRRRHH